MRPSQLPWACLVVFSFLTSAALAAGIAWEPVGISGYGGLFSPAISPVNPKLMMIHCDMSAAYLSHDGGYSWRMVHQGQLRASTTCNPAFHPTDVRVIYSAQAYVGLKVSRDGGETWSRVPGTPRDLCGQIAIDPSQPTRMLIGDRKSIYLSTDGGGSWKQCPGPHGEAIAFHFAQSSPADQRICFAATSEGIWRSDDGGQTWSSRTNGLPWTELKAFSGGSQPDAQTILYCSVTSKAEGDALRGGVYRSTDRGETWQSAMGDGINKDTKAADQWATGQVPQYICVLTSDARPRTVWAFNTNTGVRPPHHTACYRSDDAGKTWRATFYPDPRFGAYNVEPEVFATCDGQFYQGQMHGAIDAKNPDHVLAIGSSEAFVTEDGGKSWKCSHIHRAATSPDGQPMWQCNGLVVTSTWNYYFDPFNHQRQYIAYTDIGFARSLDAGKTWIWWSPKTRAPWSNTCYELAFDPVREGKIWGAFSNTHDIPNYNIIGGSHREDRPGGVCISTDRGKSWAKSNEGLPAAPCLSVVLDPRSPEGNRTLYASMFNNGIYKSTDDGKTWSKSSDGLGHRKNMRTCRLALHQDGTLFALITAKRERGAFLREGAGLWRSTDQAQNWQQINKDQPLFWPKDFTVDPADSRLIYMGACDANGQQQGGLYRTTDGGATWTRILRKGPQHFGAYLHPKHPDWIYATLTEGAPDSGLWLSKDAGETFKPMSLPFANAQRVTVDPDNENVILVTTFGGSIWRGPADE